MVWNTTQSALYNAERCCERKVPCAEEKRADTPRPRAPKNKQKGLFDDGDTLLLLVLLYILMRENSDQSLIMSLLIAMLM